MGTLDQHVSGSVTKMMLIGDSGSGKTGALASLVFAGYNLRILDFDNGIDILANVLRQKDPALLKKVRYITCTDKMSVLGGKIQATSSKAWNDGVNALSDWKDGAEPALGGVTTWGPKDVLVVDSLTFAGKAALRFICALNGRLAVKPFQSDYGDAQSLVENFLGMLFSTSLSCNVIVLSHIREVGKSATISVTDKDGKEKPVVVEEEGTRKGYAETGTGKALSPIVGRFFNSVLMVEIIGEGQYARRQIVTVPTGNIGLKNSAPGLVKPKYSLETGLAEYFAAIRNEAPPKA